MKFRNAVWPLFVLATVLFYSILLFAPEASIHWDLADVSYPVQKYFAEATNSRTLPYWTPYIFSGTPLLADPQVGAWYPLHWPFFLKGIVPRSLAWELALHAFLAMGGAYLLARRMFGDPPTAILAGVFYAWSGYFAAHSSDLGLFEAAALLPWLLWLALEAAETGEPRWFAASGFAGACIVLTGSIDGAVYSLFALVCFAPFGLVARSGDGRLRATRAILVVACIAFISILLGAVMIIPWLKIAPYATRTGVNAPGLAGARLDLKALGTAVSADHLGLISGRVPEDAQDDRGDPRQRYFYVGLLAFPLAVAGMLRPGVRLRLRLLALVLPAVWYAFGAPAGLARALAVFPAFRDARAPVEIWFVAALGLALAASSGAGLIRERAGRAHLPYVLIVLAAADLWFWNFYKNPLVLARVSFETLYQRSAQRFEQRLEGIQTQQFYRIFATQPIPTFGPMDGTLLSHTAVTYGHNLLQLNRHAEYVRELPSHPLLLSTLATHALDLNRRVLSEVPAARGLFTAPQRVTFVADAAAALRALDTLDPAQAAIAETAPQSVESGAVVLTTVALEDHSVLVYYSSAGPTLLRFAIPYAPGWRAVVDGVVAPVVPMDYAFVGVSVPGGAHELTLDYSVPGFAAGGVTSVAGLVVLVAILIFPSRLRSEASKLRGKTSRSRHRSSSSRDKSSRS